MKNAGSRAGRRAHGLKLETEHDPIVGSAVNWWPYNRIALSETLTAWIRTIALEAVVGLSIGGIIGMFMAIARRRDLKSAWLDALLGAIGFAGGATGAALAPWHQTRTTKNVGGTIISVTSLHYPYPYRVAFAASIGLVLICELIRGLRARSKARESRP